jgi:uncharacterized protein (TIGR02453 family)
MLALIAAINQALADFAPGFIRDPARCMMRIYRDTRFSKNKQPYKTHLAAWWSRHGMEKTSGGGYYLQVGPQGVMVAAGVYMPEREQLLAIRRWMSVHHLAYRKELAKLLRSKTLGFTPIDAHPLTRMPKGFAADDPADELIRATSWGIHAELPASLALQPAFITEVLKRFKAATSITEMLNQAILEGSPRAIRKPLF